VSYSPNTLSSSLCSQPTSDPLFYNSCNPNRSTFLPLVQCIAKIPPPINAPAPLEAPGPSPRTINLSQERNRFGSGYSRTGLRREETVTSHFSRTTSAAFRHHIGTSVVPPRGNRILPDTSMSRDVHQLASQDQSWKSEEAFSNGSDYTSSRYVPREVTYSCASTLASGETGLRGGFRSAVAANITEVPRRHLRFLKKLGNCRYGEVSE